jgi:hypothetical protein
VLCMICCITDFSDLLPFSSPLLYYLSGRQRGGEEQCAAAFYCRRCDRGGQWGQGEGREGKGRGGDTMTVSITLLPLLNPIELFHPIMSLNRPSISLR